MGSELLQSDAALIIRFLSVPSCTEQLDLVGYSSAPIYDLLKIPGKGKGSPIFERQAVRPQITLVKNKARWHYIPLDCGYLRGLRASPKITQLDDGHSIEVQTHACHSFAFNVFLHYHVTL